jgi:hypothetical protein
VQGASNTQVLEIRPSIRRPCYRFVTGTKKLPRTGSRSGGAGNRIPVFVLSMGSPRGHSGHHGRSRWPMSAHREPMSPTSCGRLLGERWTASMRRHRRELRGKRTDIRPLPRDASQALDARRARDGRARRRPVSAHAERPAGGPDRVGVEFAEMDHVRHDEYEGTHGLKRVPKLLFTKSGNPMRPSVALNACDTLSRRAVPSPGPCVILVNALRFRRERIEEIGKAAARSKGLAALFADGAERSEASPASPQKCTGQARRSRRAPLR